MRTSALAVVGGLSSLAAVASAQPAFQRVGLPAGLEPLNPAFSDAYGVANDGTVVGSMYVPNVGFRGFRWNPSTGLVQVNGLNSDSGFFARTITPDASIIVGEITRPQLAGRKVGSNPIEGLAIPDVDVYDATAGNDASDDGSVVVGLLSRIEDGTFRAARWSQADGWLDLGVLDASNYESAANGTSSNGNIVIGYSVGDSFNAFKWTQASGMTALPNPFGIPSDSSAIAMSGDGSVIGGQARNGDGVSKAVVWFSDGSTLVLGELAGYDTSAAYAVSGDGSLIGGTVAIDSVGSDRAVIWTRAGAVTDLQQYLTDNGVDVAGWQLTAITEISANGQYLAGRGFNPDGALESFRITLPSGCPCFADFDGSGGTPDAGDIDAFFTTWLLGDPAADADCSGGTPDAGDIDAFFTQWLAGGCA
jgi:uncharacterized membrane protein